MPESIVTCDNLVKIYKVADLEVVALQGLDLEVAPGEMMAIVGASGSGKTTLLNILSGLDIPSAGRCVVDGNDLTRLSEAQRIAYRRHVVGHVWQQSGRNLLTELTAAANIELPQLLGGVKTSKRTRHAEELLVEIIVRVGLHRRARGKKNREAEDHQRHGTNEDDRRGIDDPAGRRADRRALSHGRFTVLARARAGCHRRRFGSPARPNLPAAMPAPAAGCRSRRYR